MADLTITATSVVRGSDATVQTGTAGATITAGQPVYSDSSDAGQLKAADANASDATATVVGIALHAAGDEQPLVYQTGGSITIGATVAVGTTYVLSATAGGIAPNVDATTGWRKSHIGVATSTTVIKLNLFNSGATIP
jgi:hypothetical protein